MRRSPDGRLVEAVALARTIDLRVTDAQIIKVRRIDAGFLFGKGQIERIHSAMESSEAGLLVVDSVLSPIQQRNLERALRAKVIDRTALIIEIFGARAQTHEGKLQVELAALRYRRSRLVRSWTHLERQRGGHGFLGGPGEAQLEIDRRLIDARILRVCRDVALVRKRRTLQRTARRRFPMIALVGYTNAGKSTLFNKLTRASAVADDRLFATLDPTIRKMDLMMGQGEQALLSDTVGFISDLPTHLVTAFRATLEEVAHADLLLHVRDVATEESQIQKNDVMGVLRDLAINPDLVFEVWNKIDALSPDHQAALRARADGDGSVRVVSARTGEGVGELRAVIAGLVGGHVSRNEAIRFNRLESPAS